MQIELDKEATEMLEDIARFVKRNGKYETIDFNNLVAGLISDQHEEMKRTIVLPFATDEDLVSIYGEKINVQG